MSYFDLNMIIAMLALSDLKADRFLCFLFVLLNKLNSGLEAH